MRETELRKLEEVRQLEQELVDSSKSKKDRNKLGQFSTPRTLADELLTFAKQNITAKRIQFFDPAFGMGSFYTAFIKEFGIKSKAFGFEIDRDYYSAAKKVWSECNNLTLKNTDFILENSANKQADLIVCNPPYIRHQHIKQQTKKRLQELVQNLIVPNLRSLKIIVIKFACQIVHIL